MKTFRFGLLLLGVLVLTIPGIRLTGQLQDRGPLVRIETTKGDMVVRLYNETPLHRDNMLKLAGEGFYRDQLFHRVIRDFMIQGGDPHSVGADRGQRLGTGGPGYTLPAEFRDGLIHKKGALAAARMGDRVNPEKESSGSQFYIVQGRKYNVEMLRAMEQNRSEPFSPEAIATYTSVGGTPHLDGSYTVFGEVISGLEVIDSIAAMPVDANNRPLEDVVFNIVPGD